MKFHPILKAVAAAMALASTPLVQASMSGSIDWTDLSLSVTDDSGVTNTWAALEVPGGLGGLNSLFLTRSVQVPNSFDVAYEGLQSTPVDSLVTAQPITLSQNLPVVTANTSLGSSASGQPSIKFEAQIASGLPLSAPGPNTDYVFTGGLDNSLNLAYMKTGEIAPLTSPASGGIWLAPGSTATFSGTATVSAFIDPSEFATAPASAKLSVLIQANSSLLLQMVPANGGLESVQSDDNAGGTMVGASAYVPESPLDITAGTLGNSAQGSFSTSITNNSDVGQWLLPSTNSFIVIERAAILPTPAVPEPATYALMGLGLVGLALTARRQRARNC